jgi:hypothetical protein
MVFVKDYIELIEWHPEYHYILVTNVAVVVKDLFQWRESIKKELAPIVNAVMDQ